jgi:kynurenine formamidase
MPVYPGHPPVAVDATRTLERDGYFLQTLSLGEHTGSHVDAPAHVLGASYGATIDLIPPDRFVAPYATIDLSGLALGPGDLASADQIRAVVARDRTTFEPGDAALIHFGWDIHRDRPNGWWAANTPGLDESACSLIAGWEVGIVGSDTATCDIAVRNGRIIADHGHRTYFLPNEILLVEGLQGLGSAPPRGLLITAPLKVGGGSGAPARTLLLAEPQE